MNQIISRNKQKKYKVISAKEKTFCSGECYTFDMNELILSQYISSREYFIQRAHKKCL